MIEFQVEGMSCEHCVKVVSEAVRSVDASARVEVDLAAHRVRVDSTAPRERLASALQEAGYEPA